MKAKALHVTVQMKAMALHVTIQTKRIEQYFQNMKYL